MSYLVGPRPLDGHGVLLYSPSCELAHVSTCYAVAVGWGMYSPSCELAHEVDAPVGSGGHLFL